jgi:hypothetical protein
MQRERDDMVVETVTVDIYVGLKEGYDGIQHSLDELERQLQKICNKGLCVTMIPCKYIYKDGNENGAVVRLINYPRFPSDLRSLKEKAIDMAAELRAHFSQYRMSVQAPDVTYMLTEPSAPDRTPVEGS